MYFYEFISSFAAAFLLACLFLPKFGRLVAKLIDRHAAGVERATEAYWIKERE